MIRDTKPSLAEALERSHCGSRKASAVHVGRNHGAFDPLQAPQYQLDVKTAEPANSALRKSWLVGAGRGVTGMEMQEIRYFLAIEPDTQLHQGGRKMPCQSAGPDARYPKTGG